MLEQFAIFVFSLSLSVSVFFCVFFAFIKYIFDFAISCLTDVDASLR